MNFDRNSVVESETPVYLILDEYINSECTYVKINYAENTTYKNAHPKYTVRF